MGTKKIKKEHLVSFIIEGVKRLEEDATIEDLLAIKSEMSRVWRKYHPLSEITSLNEETK